MFPVRAISGSSATISSAYQRLRTLAIQKVITEVASPRITAVNAVRMCSPIA